MTDSNSGITQGQAKDLGIYVIPMPFMINGATYEEDINLTQAEFYDRLKEGAEISTSQPSPETVTSMWDRVLEEYDQIVHIPMSSGLSGTCQTAIMLAEDYDGRVQVVNNQRISVTQRQSAMDAMEMAAGRYGRSGDQGSIGTVKMESSIYIMLDTLKYLKQGGRITPAAAALGTLLRLKPVLQIQGEKLDAFSKARNMKQAKSVMITAITRDLENRYNDPEAEHTWLEVAHTCNQEAAEELAAELRALYPKNQGDPHRPAFPERCLPYRGGRTGDRLQQTGGRESTFKRHDFLRKWDEPDDKSRICGLYRNDGSRRRQEMEEVVKRLCQNSAQHDPKSVIALWWKLVKQYEADSYADSYITEDEIVDRLLGDLEKQIQLKDDPAALHELIRGFWVHAPLFPDAKPFYEGCPAPLYVISNNGIEYITRAMEEKGPPCGNCLRRYGARL